MECMMLPRFPLTSPACGRGRRKAPGEGSFFLGFLAGGDTLSPTLPRRRGRGCTLFVATAWSHVLAKGIRRDGLKPALGLGCLAGSQFARRIDRAGRAALDLGEDVAPGLVAAGE